ncbi:MAG: Smr/MutS family protein [Proteobacteria bacterium]|nr:Smr/MutS family protein [Pseudomonadota bacterium]
MAKDVDLFRAAMADVKPLKSRKRGRKRPPARKPPAVVPKPKVEGSLPGPERSLASPGLTEVPRVATRRPPPSLSFDGDVERALSKGKRRPEAKLDLHGMTLAAAERAVTAFIAEASAQNRRVVLIVTGKGLRLEGGRVFGGRIRAELPGWLERAENRARVAGVRPAHPRHGGSGAFYVLLRRRSSANSRSLRATPQR